VDDDPDGVTCLGGERLIQEIDGGFRVGAGGQADTTDDAVRIAMAALLERRPNRLDRAGALAATSRDRQAVAIAPPHVNGDDELVDALARDHLVDYPDSLIVAWMASNPIVRDGHMDGMS
jgi:hypothetical protein